MAGSRRRLSTREVSDILGIPVEHVRDLHSVFGGRKEKNGRWSFDAKAVERHQGKLNRESAALDSDPPISDLRWAMLQDLPYTSDRRISAREAVEILEIREEWLGDYFEWLLGQVEDDGSWTFLADAVEYVRSESELAQIEWSYRVQPDLNEAALEETEHQAEPDPNHLFPDGKQAPPVGSQNAASDSFATKPEPPTITTQSSPEPTRKYGTYFVTLLVVLAVVVGGWLLLNSADSTPPPHAICRDGWVSHSVNRQGTCSSHGGVATWLRE